jgi:LmbE family N-acetylglucosaminyl deacetylase
VKKILIVAAHPDDEILGCGGTVARLVKAGYEASTLILGEGVTARDKQRNRQKRLAEIKKLKNTTLLADRAIGVSKVFFYDFPDNRFDSIPLLDIVKVVEEVKNKIGPEIVFTHFARDLNIDHCLTYQAVITATRPQPGERVKEIYSFEILSSTEWNYPLAFSPNVFSDISLTLKDKVRAMQAYRKELRNFPHPRSVEGIKLNAQYWGMRTGLGYAEAFELVRLLK